MQNPIKMDDLGVPQFLETSIYQLFRRISSMIGRDSVDSPGRQQITRLVTGNVCRDLSVEWRSLRSLWAKKDVNKKGGDMAQRIPCMVYITLGIQSPSENGNGTSIPS